MDISCVIIVIDPSILTVMVRAMMAVQEQPISENASTTTVSQGQPFCQPTPDKVMPRMYIPTKGSKASNLISGSRTPLFFLVALMATQSDQGPAMAMATILPINKGKFVNPTDCEEKLYGGDANA